MKWSLMHSTLAALLFTFLAGTQAASAAAPPAIVWRSDLNLAYFQALSEQKPLVVCFVDQDGKELLPYCRKLLQEVFTAPEMSAYADQAVFVVINAATNDAKSTGRKMMHDLFVKDVPTVAVLHCTPRRIESSGEIVGHYAPAEFAKLFGNLQADCVAKIAADNTSRITPEQAAAKAREVCRKIDDKSASVVQAAENYRQVLNNLMVSSPVDVDGLKLAYNRVIAANGEFAVALREMGSLPAPEAAELAVGLLESMNWELDQIDRLQADVLDLINRTHLADTAAREQVQTLVLNAEHAASDEFSKRTPALRAVGEKFRARYGIE